MAELAELSWQDRSFVEEYAWRRVTPSPFSTPRRGLMESRVALISTAGMVLPGQEPFSRLVRGGDVSFREIPGDADPARMRLTHKSRAFSRDGIQADRNLGFPIDRIHELAETGQLGEVAPRHLSFMGSITAPGRLVDRSAPEAIDLLVEDEVDVALLVPV